MHGHTKKELSEYPGDQLKVVGVLVLVGPPTDELYPDAVEEDALSDTQVIGAVVGFNMKAAENGLLEMALDYIADNGPIPEDCELRMDYASWLRYQG